LNGHGRGERERERWGEWRRRRENVNYFPLLLSQNAVLFGVRRAREREREREMGRVEEEKRKCKLFSPSPFSKCCALWRATS
jgi:hypothetical protein